MNSPRLPAITPLARFSTAGQMEVVSLSLAGDLRSPFAEDHALADALNRRGPHYLGGRLAAYAAMARLGRSETHIPRGEDGAPQWPTSLVGSVAHTHGMAVAAVALRHTVRAIGIDIERCSRRLDEGVRSIVCHPDELAWLDAAPPLPVQPLLMLVCAKEVVFKLYYPPTKVRLTYRDAVVRPTRMGLTATLQRDLPLAPHLPRTVNIEWEIIDEYIVLLGCIL